MPAPRTVRVTRYVTPLREGGSLPAIVEADDDGMYVLKFRGAGQGPRALIAELVSGEIARALGLPVPELVFAELDPDLARTEPDPEIHALIHGQRRPEPGARLPARLGHLRSDRPEAGRGARVAHRLVRRLRDQRRPHRAQHQHADVAPPAVADRPRRDALLSSLRRAGTSDAARPRDPFPLIKNHVLLTHAGRSAAIDDSMARALDAGRDRRRSSSWIPDGWLTAREPGRDAARLRRRTCAT